MSYKNVLSLFIGIVATLSFAQQPATSAETVKNALAQKRDMAKTSLVKNVPFENIGPTIMSGRVADVDVNPDNPTEFFVG